LPGETARVVRQGLSAEQQNYFHQGYESTARDRHDMAQLRRAFGIVTHF
jgi:lincosamide nucleotidyltransferase A/C/D/E